MPYIDRPALESRFGQTAVAQAAWRDDLDTEATIAAAIKGAGELIDGYLAGGGYGLPLSPVPALLAEIALDVAWYKLWRGPIPDDVRDRYKDSVRMLEAIQAGRIELQTGGVEIEADAEILIQDAPRLFDRDTLRGF